STIGLTKWHFTFVSKTLPRILRRPYLHPLTLGDKFNNRFDLGCTKSCTRTSTPKESLTARTIILKDDVKDKLMRLGASYDTLELMI
ncbi:hypothetical protein D0864_16979, partial [Hortaea werneckii]